MSKQIIGLMWTGPDERSSKLIGYTNDPDLAARILNAYKDGGHNSTQSNPVTIWEKFHEVPNEVQEKVIASEDKEASALLAETGKLADRLKLLPDDVRIRAINIMNGHTVAGPD